MPGVVKHLQLARFVQRSATVERLAPRSAQAPVDLAVVAFENEAVLDAQLSALRERLVDTYDVTVFDNSPTAAGRSRIEGAALRGGAGYVGLPRNPLTGGDPSGSHALALNWAWRNVLRARPADVVGFLDPDVFPERETSVLEVLGDQACWGHLQTRGERWYLWAGFAFFRRPRRLDFMPRDGLDTGGGNWRLLFRDLDRETLRFPAHSYVASPPVPGVTAERLGDWLHTFNSSGWR